jgi:hypothetical protein
MIRHQNIPSLWLIMINDEDHYQFKQYLANRINKYVQNVRQNIQFDFSNVHHN